MIHELLIEILIWTKIEEIIVIPSNNEGLIFLVMNCTFSLESSHLYLAKLKTNLFSIHILCKKILFVSLY